MFSLKGKNALITGATGGIGRAIAQKFHAAGANLAISGTRQAILDDLVNELKSNVTTIAANLKDPNDVIKLYAEAEEKLGQVDIIVCNAGITRDNLLIRMSEEEFDDVIAVNLKAVWLLNREAAKKMTRRKSGRIINISSVVGQFGNFGQTNYAAAKAGIIGMTKSVALECATRGVTANCIAPGFIKTPMTESIDEKIVNEKILPKIPMGKLGEPDDIAYAALFLASDEARIITGHTLDVNAGMYLR